MTHRSARFASLVVCSLLGVLVVAVVGACANETGAKAASGESSPAAATADDDAPVPTMDEIAQWEWRRERPSDIARGLQLSAPPLVRARAALALGRLQHQQAVDALLGALRDPVPLVRQRAAFGLGQLDEAFDPKRTTHGNTRERVESHLAGNVNRESDANARKAIVRALGKVGRAKGLRVLTALAAAGPMREPALTAIGVNATRDAPHVEEISALASAIHAGIVDPNPAVQRAAAYAAFRQKLPLNDEEIAMIAGASTPEARIHLLRALHLTPRRAPLAQLKIWLRNLDWRVRFRAIEVAKAAMREGADYPASILEAPLNAAIERLVGGQLGGDAHVVSAACEAIANTRPDEGRMILERALRNLGPLLPAHASTRCACAVARDGIDGAINAVTKCHGGTYDATAARRLEIAVVKFAGIPSVVRAKSLQVALRDSDRLVRLDAARVAAGDDTEAIAILARHALAEEGDPGVIAAHLEGFVGKRREARFEQIHLTQVVRRLLAQEGNDTLEPLLLAAQIAAERGFSTTTTMLVGADDTRVVDAARDVPLLDRPLGPRATIPKPTALSELPSTAIITTDRGDISIKLLRSVAPATVATFVALAKQNVTPGTMVHRVVPDFVAQGGDPRNDGYGGPGFTIPCERSDEPYTTGTVGMALAGLDTGGSQFFIVHSDQPHLDGRYSVFGRVVAGKDVADMLMPQDRIISIRFEDGS